MKSRGLVAARVFAGSLFAIGLVLPCSAMSQISVFETDFEDGLPSEFSAPGATIVGVQGYAGLGHPGRQFSGGFLRYAAQTIEDTTLSLTDLPEHDSLTLGFLLAVIDSWDGVELFEVRIDGQLLFSNWFELALGDSSSYDAPEGALLSAGTNLGFSSGSYYSRDRAYDLSRDPVFCYVPHSADSVTIQWSLGATSGSAAANWQGGDDESWAIDDVTVEVDTVAGKCSRPVSAGPDPSVSDCLRILQTAVGSKTCKPECICAPKGTLPPAASDALICLRKSVGQDVALQCPC